MKRVLVAAAILIAALSLTFLSSCKKSSVIEETYLETTQLVITDLYLEGLTASPPGKQGKPRPDIAPNPNGALFEYWVYAAYSATSIGPGLTLRDCELMFYNQDQLIETITRSGADVFDKESLEPGEHSHLSTYIKECPDIYDKVLLKINYVTGPVTLDTSATSEVISIIESARIREFKSDKDSVQKGESVTLSWKVDYAESITLLWDGEILAENLPAVGQFTVTPSDSDRARNIFALTALSGEDCGMTEYCVVTTGL